VNGKYDGRKRVVMPSPKNAAVLHSKLLSNIREIQARGAITIVIAEEGDTVRIVDGRVYVNDIPLRDDYVPAEYRSHDDWGPQVIPEGYDFVMGDHRNNSSDSRHWGMVPKRYIIGKITNDALYLAQGEKDAAVLANVQALSSPAVLRALRNSVVLSGVTAFAAAAVPKPRRWNRRTSRIGCSTRSAWATNASTSSAPAASAVSGSAAASVPSWPTSARP